MSVLVGLAAHQMGDVGLDSIFVAAGFASGQCCGQFVPAALALVTLALKERELYETIPNDEGDTASAISPAATRAPSPR